MVVKLYMKEAINLDQKVLKIYRQNFFDCFFLLDTPIYLEFFNNLKFYYMEHIIRSLNA